MSEVNFLIAFSAGLFSFLSPCVLPLIPSYLSFVSGVSLEDIQSARIDNRVRRQVVLHSLAFIIGFSLVFVSLGASASYLGSLFFGYRDFIRILGGTLVLLVGLYLVGAYKIPIMERYAQVNLKQKPAGYLGSTLVGVTFAAAWTPCVGPILGAILAIAGTSGGGIDKGILLLTTYAAGLALPFFLSAVALNYFFSFSKRFRRHIQAVHTAAAILLILVGILLITNYMIVLNAYALRFTPDWLIKRL